MIALSDLRARLELPASDDVTLVAMRDSLIALWEQETGRPWVREVDHVEILRSGPTRRALFLQLHPVESITKVEQILGGPDDWEELDAEAYWFDGRRRLEKNSGYWRRLVRVTYTGGVTESASAGQFKTPADVTEALLAQAVFSHRRNAPDKIALRSEGLKDSQTSYLSADLHPLFKTAVRAHRRKV